MISVVGSAGLFLKHLFSRKEDVAWDLQPEFFGPFQIEYQGQPCGVLDGQMAGFTPLRIAAIFYPA